MPRRPHARHVVIAALLVLAAAWLFAARASHRMPDFEVYWRAGARAAAGEPLYRDADADYQFKYFPAFAILMVPLGALPLGAAKGVWFALSIAALAALLAAAVASIPARRKPVWLIVLVLLIGLGKYYAEDLVLGQINTLVALTVACAALALTRGRERLGGALVAAAVVLKPYALILVPWMAARRRGPSLASLAAGLAVACVLPAAAYGLTGAAELHAEWWRTVSATTEGTLLHSDNVSLASLWAKRAGVGPAAAWLAGVSSVVLLAVAGLTFRQRAQVSKPEGLEAGLLIALTPLLSPQGWDYVLVLATVAMAYVVNDHDRLPRSLRTASAIAIAAIGLSLYDLLGRRILYLLLDYSVPTLGVLVLLGALVTLRIKRLA